MHVLTLQAASSYSAPQVVVEGFIELKHDENMNERANYDILSRGSDVEVEHATYRNKFPPARANDEIMRNKWHWIGCNYKLKSTSSK